MGRAVAAAGLAVTLVWGLAGCAGSVDRADVASSISAELGKQGMVAQDVICPEDLKAEVGKSVRCTLQVDGVATAAVATVTSLQGDQAHYDIETDKPVVGKAALQKQVADQLGQAGVTTGPVTCPSGLKAETGATVRCGFDADGQPVDAVAKVTSVEGTDVTFDISTEARPIAKALLEQKVGQQVGQQAGIAIESTQCTGDLPPTVGATVGCTVAAQDETLNLDVAVTAVNGGQVDYSLRPKT
ncbi:DUF4333 domain-containing protein [Pseudonocardia acidicola]|uniref:DUF4333 domain-containing protein n=1 Tax=Pseudonocardia acidicola TaxID=2724939 RepID=A0ABX1SE94_9PSEU|nr:DUF4333 domain-containing protein [Pseudonocardia acidicola]NMH99127.1 DUF4333 domain-containing protein [Pseudonocardia acidicola]